MAAPTSSETPGQRTLRRAMLLLLTAVQHQRRELFLALKDRTIFGASAFAALPPRLKDDIQKYIDGGMSFATLRLRHAFIDRGDIRNIGPEDTCALWTIIEQDKGRC